MFSISSSNCCCVRFWVPCGILALGPSTAIALAIAGGPYLEGKVLEKVRGSVGLVRLCAAAGIDPHTDGRRLGPRGVLGSDLRIAVNCSPQRPSSAGHTVKPFFSVVDSVLEP